MTLKKEFQWFTTKEFRKLWQVKPKNIAEAAKAKELAEPREIVNTLETFENFIKES
jgi:hypothetical protein